MKDRGAQSRTWTGTPCGKSFWDFRGYLFHHSSILTHLCIPTSAASQGFVTIQNSKNILHPPAIRNPQTRLLGQRGLTKPQRRLVYFFQSNKRSCLFLQKPPFLLIWERKVESLSCKRVLLLIFRTEKGFAPKRLRRRFWLFYWGSKTYKKAGAKGGTWTHTSFHSPDPKSGAAAISPLSHIVGGHRSIPTVVTL